MKRQRNQAKLNADEVAFLSFSEMWRITPQTQETVEAEAEEVPTETTEAPEETEVEAAE